MKCVVLKCETFADQGWGNAKGDMHLCLYDGDTPVCGGPSGTTPFRETVFGTPRSHTFNFSPTARGVHVFQRPQSIIAEARPGHHYRLETHVGGGGGHAVRIQGLRCWVHPE